MRLMSFCWMAISAANKAVMPPIQAMTVKASGVKRKKTRLSM